MQIYKYLDILKRLYNDCAKIIIINFVSNKKCQYKNFHATI